MPFVHEGLGNASYLLDLGDGRAAVIDPQRDARPYLQAAHRRGLRVTHAVETHVHADFVTGTRELAHHGAQIVAAGAAGLAFPHQGLGDGQRLDLGGLALELLATPGHTPEHAAWLLREGEQPLGVFTGGALIVGGVARTDLAGANRTEELARSAYRSLHQRLLALPDALPVWPTHGPGSFCSAGGSGERTSTIGEQKAANPLLAGDPDEEEFVRRLVSGLGSYPDYFTWLPEYNRAGPQVLSRAWPHLPSLPLEQFLAQAMAEQVQLVDVRSTKAFAAGHVPDSIAIELRPQFASWLGWVIDPHRPVAFITDGHTDRDELINQCLGIGYENVLGDLAGGFARWQAAGLPVARIAFAEAEDLTARPVLDVRQRSEFGAAHVPGALNVELGSLESAELLGGVPTDSSAQRPLVTMCAHGQRSMTAASLLARARGNTEGIAVFTGSAQGWAQRTGRRISSGT
ncbi:MBL fold metallo-hydrolase [Kineococcus sp. SYSU DK002]|uniref:MBL fold metallo-hydrolase n=1 Tax=Kineococcus sp. SYSU DK002 TaxID=3383123 RepID=UPI003D7E1491